MPLCKCLIINKIKYFLKFFLVVKERMPNFAIGNREEHPTRQSSLTYESIESRKAAYMTGRQGETPETTLHHRTGDNVSRFDAFLLSSLAGRKGTRVFPVGYAIPFRFDSGSDRKNLC